MLFLKTAWFPSAFLQVCSLIDVYDEINFRKILQTPWFSVHYPCFWNGFFRKLRLLRVHASILNELGLRFRYFRQPAHDFQLLQRFLSRSRLHFFPLLHVLSNLSEVLLPQTHRCSSLLHLQQMCGPNGSPLSLDKQLRGPFQPALLFQLLSLDHARLWILLAHSISLSTLGGVALAQDLQALRLSLLVVYLDHSRSRCSHWLSLHSHLKRPDNSRAHAPDESSFPSATLR